MTWDVGLALILGLVVGAFLGFLIAALMQAAATGGPKEGPMYGSYAEAAKAIVVAVNEVYPIAREERPQYEKYVEEALREDTHGIIRRCNYLQERFVIQYLNDTGFMTMRVSLDLLFPKTMGLINKLE